MDRVWVFANIAVAVCALPNLLAVLALPEAFMKLMRDYLGGSLRYATRATDRTHSWVRAAGPAPRKGQRDE